MACQGTGRPHIPENPCVQQFPDWIILHLGASCPMVTSNGHATLRPRPPMHAECNSTLGEQVDWDLTDRGWAEGVPKSYLVKRRRSDAQESLKRQSLLNMVHLANSIIPSSSQI